MAVAPRPAPRTYASPGSPRVSIAKHMIRGSLGRKGWRLTNLSPAYGLTHDVSLPTLLPDVVDCQYFKGKNAATHPTHPSSSSQHACRC